MSCPFCMLPVEKIVYSNEFSLMFYDSYPVTKYHTLIIPRRHVADYFELTNEEVDAMQELLYRQKERLLQLDKTITGFNIGINVGKDAGQSIFHVHMHLIPRREGDMKEPKGGVRGVIPEKQKY
ncbi:HIT family protein [Sulfurovum sp. CS9]|uniref:HIT family protein n=1 Tax=Sulfurovum sp. CS9 TaxID=3391146 RepID=UPI0039EBF267